MQIVGVGDEIIGQSREAFEISARRRIASNVAIWGALTKEALSVMNPSRIVTYRFGFFDIYCDCSRWKRQIVENRRGRRWRKAGVKKQGVETPANIVVLERMKERASLNWRDPCSCNLEKSAPPSRKYHNG